MDKHTFIGKRKVGSTDICDFTDYQGIGQDPLYRRYESVFSVVKRHIEPHYAHFLAAPDYSEKEDAINWYIEDWNDTPVSLTSIGEDKKSEYQRIKNETVSHYRNALNALSGEELQVLACALRYIDDDFIFCCDGKVYLVAWGMTPDTHRHISKGELIHEAPMVIRHTLSFNAGDNGSLKTKIDGHISLPEGSIISPNDIPTVAPDEGYIFKGWRPDPLGMTVTSDTEFVAQYEAIPARADIPPVVPPPPPTPRNAICSFEAGDHGTLNGNSEVYVPSGSRLQSNDLPGVVANKGYIFKGWNINPLTTIIKGNTTFTAIYEKKLTWYRRLWLWLTGRGCLKWLLWALIGLILLLLLSWLLNGCRGCTRSVNGVAEPEIMITASGDTIDNNGFVRPITLHDGRLPDVEAIVAPIRNEEGDLPPIIRDAGVPPVIANRLFLFLEDENDNIDALASDFKKVYPGDQYSIIGFDRDVKSLLIQIPEQERDQIRRTINSKIPNHKFIVFDEEIYELNGHMSTTAASTPGWHLNAVKAPQGWEITKGDPSVIVAIVDDGIDPTHPMFKNRIVDAYNVYTQNNKLGTGEGHGTHTAGLAVGSLDFRNQGAAGIAPECKLMPVQVVDNSMCPLSAIISGIMYAVHKNADVVNISIGPSLQGLNELPIELQSQIARTQFKNVEKLWSRVCRIAADKNTILVFAAGNDDIISSIPPENRSSAAITVGAVDQKLYPTDFTNYGPCTDISAPGKEIYSSFPTRDFKTCDGTSMAAPIVTGTVALMKSLKKDLTVEQARNVLYRTGCDVYGNMPPMVQVNLALEAVKRGDFSAPEQREMRPVPGITANVGDTDIPSSWTNPVTGIIITEPGETESDVAISSGEPPIAPVDEHESDYDAIRRQIAIYKEKITKLEEQLPETKR